MEGMKEATAICRSCGMQWFDGDMTGIEIEDKEFRCPECDGLVEEL